MLPNVAAETVGAVVELVPLAATVYHNKLLPVAESCTDVEPWHNTTGLVTAGAAGTDVMFTVITTLVGLSQPDIVCDA